MPDEIKLAGINLWPGLFLTPRATKSTTSIDVVATAGRPVVQRFVSGGGNILNLGCSLDGDKAVGGYYLYSALVLLQQAKDSGVPVPLYYFDDPVRSVIILSVPESPIKQVTRAELAPEWSAVSWYTGSIQLMQVS